MLITDPNVYVCAATALSLATAGIMAVVAYEADMVEQRMADSIERKSKREQRSRVKHLTLDVHPEIVRMLQPCDLYVKTQQCSATALLDIVPVGFVNQVVPSEMEGLMVDAANG